MMRAVRVAAVFALVVTTFIVPPVLGQADWNLPQDPFQIFANTYYVGPRGLSAILITSEQGHVLIDAALPESAAAIASSVRALGFQVEDIRLIVNSHVHFDHAGGIAELQRLSGATVAATAWSASVLTSGVVPSSDPQFGVVPPIAPVTKVRTVRDGETLRVGPLAMTAHETPGHTPGGTSWTWRSCDAGTCMDMVYADSLTAVSADGFLFTRSPNAIADFERSFRTLEAISCGILLTPHPEASRSWTKDPAACGRYVETARDRLRKRVAAERANAEP